MESTTIKIVSPARPPLPSHTKKPLSPFVPMTFKPFVLLRTQTGDRLKHVSSRCPHHPPNAVSPSLSPTLSSFAAVMPPLGNAASTPAGAIDDTIAVTGTLKKLQGSEECHVVDVPGFTSVKEWVLEHNAERSHLTTDMALACAKSFSNFTSLPRAGVVKFVPMPVATAPLVSATNLQGLTANVDVVPGAATDAWSHRVRAAGRTTGVSAFEVSFMPGHVANDEGAVPCMRNNRSARKRRLDAPASEPQVKKLFFSTNCFEVREEGNPGKDIASSNTQYDGKRKRRHDTTGMTFRKKHAMCGFKSGT